MDDNLDLDPLRATSVASSGGGGVPKPVIAGGVALVVLLAVFVVMKKSSDGSADAESQDSEETADDADIAQNDTLAGWDGSNQSPLQ